MNVTNLEKILSNYACNKLGLAILLWQHECIFIAGLEQEIESLKKKLAGSIRDKQNIQEELSEAYRIKGQLADLHSAEVLKNKDAEKQLKFFQSCVAAAFSERDHALMESEKAKEQEEAISQKLTVAENRLLDLQSAYNDEKRLNSDLLMELRELKELNESFEKVIDKFHAIRGRETGCCGDESWQGKCSGLLDDPLDKWIFNSDSKTSTLDYIRSLEEELETRKRSIDKLQNNLRMGLDIERHFKRNVQSLERKQIIYADTVTNGLSALRDFHNQQKFEVMKMLEETASHLKSVAMEVLEKLNENINSGSKFEGLKREQQNDNAECRDVHIASDIETDVLTKRSDLATTNSPTNRTPDTSNALAQALEEKVATLMLLSQEEERHLLERDVNKALQKKTEELQRNLSQVTSEKVKALMDLAQLKQEYQVLQENNSHVLSHGNPSVGVTEKSISVHEQEGKIKNLLKKTYLKHWIGKEHSEREANFQGATDESRSSNKRNACPEDFARLTVENAAFKESMANMEHLTSSIQRLRFTLLKAQEDAKSAGSLERVTEALSSIIAEANLVKTALGSSLPVSWSTDPTVDAATYENLYEPTDTSEGSRSNRVDPVSVAGLQMVELVILAAELLKERVVKSDPAMTGIC